ncbi:MAG: NADH-quinone oxidoreductase subunit C [Thermodesulfobacteriota bacterium]
MLAAQVVAEDDLRPRVAGLKELGFRLVAVTCVGVTDGRAELLYHFDRDLHLIHLRLAADAARPLPSITPVFAAAYLAENEIQDQFGLTFAGLDPDYGGSLYLEKAAGPAPFRRRLTAEGET